MNSIEKTALLNIQRESYKLLLKQTERLAVSVFGLLDAVRLERERFDRAVAIGLLTDIEVSRFCDDATRLYHRLDDTYLFAEEASYTAEGIKRQLWDLYCEYDTQHGE